MSDRLDLANYLPEYILRKSDLCTMAHGLEARAPLLDHRFVERVLALPPDERYTRPPKLFAYVRPSLAAVTATADCLVNNWTSGSTRLLSLGGGGVFPYRF